MTILRPLGFGWVLGVEFCLVSVNIGIIMKSKIGNIVLSPPPMDVAVLGRAKRILNPPGARLGWIALRGSS